MISNSLKQNPKQVQYNKVKEILPFFSIILTYQVGQQVNKNYPFFNELMKYKIY